MKLSLKALREHVDFEGSAKEASDVLASLGFPSDGIESLGSQIGEVLVARIEKMEPHPGADRLRLLKVSTGDGELRPVVCGARNMNEGDLVALAPVGATIPGVDAEGLTLQKAKIRGEISEGMCCSVRELGLGDESDGIWILPRSLESDLGRPVVEALGLRDDVIDVDVTPNRADAMSVRGLVRELAAKLKLKLKPVKVYRWKSTSSWTKPTIESFEDCFAFAACLVKGVKLGPSDAWMQNFLQAVGCRSINNLVDITNVILFEQGHPIHFFDADKVDVLSVQVRRARSGEKLKLLNEQVIELSEEDLVVADASGPLSLAGVMGGFDSSVSESTKNILIEVASFDAKRIRQTSKRHQIRSESSARFERGVGAFRVDELMERVLALVQEYSGFEGAEGSRVLSRDLQRASCLWDRGRVEKKLGKLLLSDNEIFDWLRRLDYEFDSKSGAHRVLFPNYRQDVECLEDVMEDVARLVGYDQLEKVPLRVEEAVSVPSEYSKKWKQGQEIVRAFVERSFTEVLHWSFSSPERELLFRKSEQDLVKIQNPIHSQKSVLRTSLLPSLLERAQYNADRSEEGIRLVELGPVYRRGGPSEYVDSPVGEELRVGCVFLSRPSDRKKLWANKGLDPFYEFKGAVEASLGYQGVLSSEAADLELQALFHPRRFWMAAGGLAGELHPKLLKFFGLSGRCFLGEWVLSGEVRGRSFSKPSERPPVELDWSIVVPSVLRFEEIFAGLEKCRPSSLESMQCFDVYESPELEKEGRLVLSFRLRYREAERSLSMEEAMQLQDRLLKDLQAEFPQSQIALR